MLDRLACLSDAYPLTIHKHRTRPQVLYRICRCRECKRLADHLVPRLHPQLDESQMNRRRPRTQNHPQGNTLPQFLASYALIGICGNHFLRGIEVSKKVLLVKISKTITCQKLWQGLTSTASPPSPDSPLPAHYPEHLSSPQPRRPPDFLHQQTPRSHQAHIPLHDIYQLRKLINGQRAYHHFLI